jgi:hypothetical protein
VKLKKVIEAVNQMQSDGVIGPYAIGGAVGATYYLEPVRTLDIDIFVAFSAKPGEFVTLDPIYEYLRKRGYDTEGGYVIIERSLVQFLAAGPLVEEAIAQANEVDLEGQTTFILSAEHLVAIALQTDRAKDKARILQFIEAEVIDQTRLHNILERYGLLDRWRTFQKTFLGIE